VLIVTEFLFSIGALIHYWHFTR